jgi:hypothetical protein
MPRRPRNQTFTQQEAMRALKAIKRAGVKARVEINVERRTISIIPEDVPKYGGTIINPWDEVLSKIADEERRTRENMDRISNVADEERSA